MSLHNPSFSLDFLFLQIFSRKRVQGNILCSVKELFANTKSEFNHRFCGYITIRWRICLYSRPNGLLKTVRTRRRRRKKHTEKIAQLFRWKYLRFIKWIRYWAHSSLYNSKKMLNIVLLLWMLLMLCMQIDKDAANLQRIFAYKLFAKRTVFFTIMFSLFNFYRFQFSGSYGPWKAVV